MGRRFFQTISIGLLVSICLFSLSSTRQTDTEHVSLNDVLANKQALTLQVKAQQTVTEKLRSGIVHYKAASGTALLVSSHSGEVVGVASYDSDARTETLEEITRPYEPGSVMKPLLVAAALNTKSIDMNYRYYDNDWDMIGEKYITNAQRHIPSERTLQEVITLSLNTGVVNILKQMGDNAIDIESRDTWHHYLVGYRFNKPTSTGIGMDSAGFIPPATMPGASSRYAQTAFGIGVTVTPAQITAAYAAITTDGVVRSPCLLRSICNKDLSSKVISQEVTPDIRKLLATALRANNPAALHAGYTIGGKSGTAPIALPGGVYRSAVENGTYIGFFGKTDAQYTLLVRLKQPIVDGYASTAAAYVWADMVQALIGHGY